MPTILNTPECKSAGAGNTGIASCYFNPKKIIGIILANPNKVYDSTDLADLDAFKAALQADVISVTTGARIYPIYRFNEITDNSEDPTYNTTGYGDEEFASEGSYKWMFKVAKGGLCLQKNLRKFNDGNWGCFLIDEDNQLIGTKNADGNLIPVTCNFHADKWKVNDGSKPTQYMIRLTLSRPEEVNDDGKVAYVSCGGSQTDAFDFQRDIKGILDLVLVEVESALGIATVQVLDACSKVNLYDTYSTELADDTLWTVTDSTGTTVVISSVTADSGNKAFDIAFTGTGDHYIDLVAPATLAAAGIGGLPENYYEGVEVKIDMPVS